MDIEENFRKETPEPDLVPIVDCLVSVIFFLLFSTTFIELTKIIVPPSAVATATTAENKVPLSPKFYLDISGGMIELMLTWGGDNPGSIKGSVRRQDSKMVSEGLEAKVKEMTDDFMKKHSSEKTIQIALSREANYQEMITMMDGLNKSTKNLDIVLMSPDEVKNKDVR